jgi:hypothetical protein
MNTAGIYNESYECNARSSLIQLSYLDTLINNLNSEAALLKSNPKLLQWQAFIGLRSLNERQIIQRLSEYPKDQWVEILKTSYKNHFITETISIQDQPSLSEYLTLASEIEATVSDIGRKSWIDRTALHDIVLQKLHASNKKIFKQAKETGKIENISQYLVGANHSSSIFSSSVIIDINKTEITIGDKNIEVTISETNSENEIIYHGFSKASLENTAYSERIYVVKHLVSAMLEYSREYKVFQLPYANIICDNSTQIISALKSEFEKDKIKESTPKEGINDLLVSAMLMSDRPKYFISHDGIFNKNTEGIAWQMYIILHLCYLGYQHIPVFTSETGGEQSMIRAILRKSIPNEV